jgi:hypothetical protein
MASNSGWHVLRVGGCCRVILFHGRIVTAEKKASEHHFEFWTFNVVDKTMRAEEIRRVGLENSWFFFLLDRQVYVQ